jgi:hypothetical protein
LFREGLVESASRLERSGLLKKLQLEIRVADEALSQSGARDQRGAPHVRSDALLCGSYIGKGPVVGDSHLLQYLARGVRTYS